jgi:tRNA pseudouridine55 synthase
MGHTGTLDPLATGCMLIATDKSTKLIPLLEWKKKRYRFTVNVYQESESLDLWTETRETIKKEEKNPKDEDLINFLESIKTQVPPIFSALQINGKRAYEYARNWESLPMKSRDITIENVYIHSINLPFIDIELTVSSGWYIRSLAPVIWNFFWYSGGCIVKLERTEILISEKSLLLSEAKNLDTIIKNDFIPYEKLFLDIPFIELSEKNIEKLKNGIVSNEIEEKYKNWHNYIIFFYNEYYSLCKKIEDGLGIIKNDV